MGTRTAWRYSHRGKDSVELFTQGDKERDWSVWHVMARMVQAAYRRNDKPYSGSHIPSN